MYNNFPDTKQFGQYEIPNKAQNHRSRFAFQISRFLISLLRSHLASSFLPWIFANLTFTVPNRLHETATLLAFHHPAPAYRFHVLLVPKRALKSLSDLAPDDADFLADLFQTVQILVDRFNLAEPGYRLIANGGAYQDIPHLHFHLISDIEI